jgi:basic membrane lipoprotein Med (substrate-binding protein (PBP1-ABC) superfamily)
MEDDGRYVENALKALEDGQFERKSEWLGLDEQGFTIRGKMKMEGLLLSIIHLS